MGVQIRSQQSWDASRNEHRLFLSRRPGRGTKKGDRRNRRTIWRRQQAVTILVTLTGLGRAAPPLSDSTRRVGASAATGEMVSWCKPGVGYDDAQMVARSCDVKYWWCHYRPRTGDAAAACGIADAVSAAHTNARAAPDPHVALAQRASPIISTASEPGATEKGATPARRQRPGE